MLQTPELSGIKTSTTVMDLARRKHEDTRISPKEIVLRGDQIAAHKFHEMLALTEKNTFEMGVTVSRGILGKITTSEIANGTKTHVDFPHPPFLNSVLSYVHTHPPLAGVNPNIPTTMFSSSDCQEFTASAAGCFVMLDAGGVHVLVRKKALQKVADLPKDLVERSVELSNKKDGLILDAMKNLANFLDGYGLTYYFTPKNTLTQNGYLGLKDVREYKSLPIEQNGVETEV